MKTVETIALEAAPIVGGLAGAYFGGP